MSQAPSMPFFIDAYLADTSHLTAEEHGAYLLLLMAMWRRGGTVPDDDKDNARVTRLSLAKWRKMKARLLPFLSIENDEIGQKRLKKEWDYVAEIRSKNARNGALGGRPVSNKIKEIEKPSGSSEHNPDESPHTHTHTHTHTQFEEKKERVVAADAASAPCRADLLDIPEFLDRRPGSEGAKVIALVPPVGDVDRAVEIFNRTAERVDWPRCQMVSAKRRKAIKARLDECGGLSGWEHAMERAGSSSFLTGKTGRSAEHANWRCSIDFLIRQDQFIKLMEGAHDDAHRNPTGSEARAEGFARAAAAYGD